MNAHGLSPHTRRAAQGLPRDQCNTADTAGQYCLGSRSGQRVPLGFFYDGNDDDRGDGLASLHDRDDCASIVVSASRDL